MATGGQSSSPPPQDPVTSLTDCPCCRSLCLGASILPCGHVLCRGCLHDALQVPTADCLQCQQPLRLPRDQSLTPSQLIQQMATDFVVEHLVLQELERQTDIPCLICPNRMAANVCLNCHEYYCETCSAHHLKIRATKGHALRLLPQAARNTSSPDSTTPPLTSSSDLSTLSMDSIRNISDQQSRDASRDSSRAVEGRRKKENGLSQQDYSDHQDIETALETIMSLAKQLLDSVREHKQVLGTYVHHVTRSDVIQGTDPGSYVIRIRDPDVSMDMKTDSFERRMNVIRKDHHCPGLDKLKMIMDQLSQLLPSPVGGKIPSSSFMNPEKSTTASSSSSSSSSPQTSTATPQNPPTQDDTPSFTPRVDWMTATPQRVFTSLVNTAGDKKKPRIFSIVCLPDDRLVMTDCNHNKVKVMDVKPPHTVSASPHIPERPWSLAVLPDGLVAMTTQQPLIYLMKVTNTVTVASRIQTVRRYEGIAGHSEGLLIVSCGQSSKGPGAVDVVTRQGQLVRTLTDSSVVLKSSWCLCPSGDQHILLSDYQLDVVHKVDVCSGQVSQTFQHTDMKNPRQVCADSDGNMFVACGGTECVMVRNRDGQWKQLLTASQHSDPGKRWPRGVCLTRSGHLVVSWGVYGGDCVVICYKFT